MASLIGRKPRRNLQTALMLTIAMSAVSLGMPVMAQTAAQSRNAFFDSDYTYCDAKLIGQLWGLSIEQGKIEIGSKIYLGIQGNLPGLLAQSRANGSACTFEDTPLTYADAVDLASIWGLDTPWDAKLRAARLYTQGRSSLVTSLIGER